MLGWTQICLDFQAYGLIICESKVQAFVSLGSSLVSFIRPRDADSFNTSLVKSSCPNGVELGGTCMTVLLEMCVKSPKLSCKTWSCYLNNYFWLGHCDKERC